jgi:hypothetical protein
METALTCHTGFFSPFVKSNVWGYINDKYMKIHTAQRRKERAINSRKKQNVLEEEKCNRSNRHEPGL